MPLLNMIITFYSVSLFGSNIFYVPTIDDEYHASIMNAGSLNIQL